MSSQLTVDQLASRLNNFPYDRYLYIGSFMRSVAWAAGTIALLTIFRNLKAYCPRLLPWSVSMLATMVTLMTWGRGVLFTNSRASVWDSLIPTFMGIVEFLLFAILVPEVFGGPSHNAGGLWQRFEPWHFWFFLLAVHTALAVVLVHNRILNTDIPNDYEPRLLPLANQYMKWMEFDRAGAWTATIASLILGVLMVAVIQIYKSSGKWWVRLIFGAAFIALFYMPAKNLIEVIRYADAQRQEADREVSEMVNASASPANQNTSRKPEPKTIRRRRYGSRKR